MFGQVVCVHFYILSLRLYKTNCLYTFFPMWSPSPTSATVPLPELNHFAFAHDPSCLHPYPRGLILLGHILESR